MESRSLSQRVRTRTGGRVESQETDHLIALPATATSQICRGHRSGAAPEMDHARHSLAPSKAYTGFALGPAWYATCIHESTTPTVSPGTSYYLQCSADHG